MSQFVQILSSFAGVRFVLNTVCYQWLEFCDILVINEVGSLRCDGVGVIVCDLSAFQSQMKCQVTSSLSEPRPDHSLDLAEREPVDSPGMVCICLPHDPPISSQMFPPHGGAPEPWWWIPLPLTLGLDVATFEPWDRIERLSFLWDMKAPSYCVIRSTESQVGWGCRSLNRVSTIH